MEQATRSTTTVAILEDDRSTREWLAASVAQAPQLALVASLARLGAARDWFAAQDADVLLADLGLPDGNGIELIRTVAARVGADGRPRTDVLVVSTFGDDETVLSCIEAGAVGYIHKDSSRADIVEAVLGVRRGESPISPMIARGLLERLRRAPTDTSAMAGRGNRASQAGNAPPAPAERLTPAEDDVLQLIARGHSYAEIARLRGVAVATVQSQIKVLYSKLAVHSRGAAVHVAGQLGLLRQPGGG